MSELEVFAECTCNGLDSACLRSNVTDLYACVCGDNSQGEFCESCLPLYNQQQYQRDTPCDREFFSQLLNLVLVVHCSLITNLLKYLLWIASCVIAFNRLATFSFEP